MSDSNNSMTLRNPLYIRATKIKKLGIVEVNDSIKEFIKTYNNKTLEIKSDSDESIELTNNIGLCNNKPVIYSIEIEGNIKNVLIGNLKTKDEYSNKLKRVKIIYARCENSMKLLDPIYRDYIQRVKFKKNKIIAVKAVAGGGKTKILLNLAKKYKNQKILYIAFNKCLISEIKNKLTNQNITNLIPKTFDALVYNSIRSYFNMESLDIQDINPHVFGQLVEWFQNKPFKLKKSYCYKFLEFAGVEKQMT